MKKGTTLNNLASMVQGLHFSSVSTYRSFKLKRVIMKCQAFPAKTKFVSRWQKKEQIPDLRSIQEAMSGRLYTSR